MRKPLCPYFGRCGGCKYQDTAYAAQLETKRELLQAALGCTEIKVISAQEYSYRNRMDMIFHPHGIGFRKKRDWRSIIDIKKCVISEPRINTLINEIRSFFPQPDAFDIIRHIGTYRYAVLRCTENVSSVSIVVNSDSSGLADAHKQVATFSEKTSADHVLFTRVPSDTDMSVSGDYDVIKGADILHTHLAGFVLTYPVQGFFQNNHAMAQQMHQYVTSLLEDHKYHQHTLLDLYGGVGAFGINNAHLFRHVHIIENFAESIACARENITLNNIKNITAQVLDAKNLSQTRFSGPLVVITDPPRSGMHKNTIRELRRLHPDHIIYISCNYHQLPIDLSRMPDYTIKSVALFDLFPQTPHFETIVELVPSP